MCGIAGVFGLDGITSTKVLAQNMSHSMRHRGPDAQAEYIDAEVVLLHARLSIIDLDARSNQPFYDGEGRYVLVFNGEIYNYKAIRAELKEFTFKTDSDTEVLLAAWKKWGINSVKRFNGMFAFSIWDKVEREMFIVRDRLGIKPLYYYNGDKNFVFASEIRTLLASELVPAKLAKAHLGEYLKFQTVHAPRTLVENVYQLKAGGYLRISESAVEQFEYWNPAFGATIENPEKSAVKKQVSQLLTSSVEHRLISDVSLGAFLSGGIDSSLLVAIATERLGKRLDTFSITFNEQEFSEAKYSQLIAKKFNTHHNEIELDVDQFRSAVPEALNAMDHPSGDGPNSFVVSRAVKQAGLTVALSGLGGDELFAGYPFFNRYLQLQEKQYLLSFPKYARSALGQLIKSLKKSVEGEKIAETLVLPYFDIPHVYPVNRAILMDKDIERLLKGKQYSNALQSDLKAAFEFGSPFLAFPNLSKVSYAEVTTYMQNVLLRDADQMSMASSLEVRVPFLDHNLVEYVFKIPDSIKKPSYPKQLLVESFEDLLPPEIVHRPKMGFVLPWEKWMKKELKPICLESLEYLSETGYFTGKSLFNLFDQFESGDQRITWSRIWPLVTLGYWMKKNSIE